MYSHQPLSIMTGTISEKSERIKMKHNEFRKYVIAVMFTLLMIAILITPSFSQIDGSVLTIQNNGVVFQNCLTPSWLVDQNVPTAQKNIPNDGVVNFPIIVTKGDLTNNVIKVIADIRLGNTGNQDATIGNVILDLQKLHNNAGVLHWDSLSVDVADATIGDAAVQVRNAAGVFKQNTASKFLEFMIGTIPAASSGRADGPIETYSIAFINPEQVVAPGQTVDLRVCGQFNNNILGLVPGDILRAQLLIAYGNAADVRAFNVDINGNGIIDADEAQVGHKFILSKQTLPTTINTDDAVMLTGPFMSVTNPVSFWNFNNGGLGSGLTLGSGDPYGTVYNFNVSLNVNASPTNAIIRSRVKLDSIVPFGSFHKKADESVWVGSTPNAAPSNLVAASGGPGEINLAWIDNTVNETGFILERWTTDFSLKTKLKLPANATSYTDTLLAPGTYNYRIVATNTFGNSTPSNIASAIAP